MDYFMRGLRKDQSLLSKVYSYKKDGPFDRINNSRLYKRLNKKLQSVVPYSGAYLPVCRTMRVTEDLYVLQFRVKKGTKKYWFLISEGFEEGD